MPKLVLFMFCKYFSNNPRVLGFKYFTKMPLVLEGHVPPLKFEIWGNELWIISKFKNRIKYEIDSKLNIFRNFQIHFSNPLFEEVMSSSLSLIWIGWIWIQKQRGKSFYSLSFKSFKFSLNFNHSIKQSNIQLLI